MNKHGHWLLVASVFLATSAALADKPAPLSALARMPVKEVTVFKDGHAFVLHEGAMPTDGDGNVLMDYLPAPVLGTFWPYSADKGAKLSAVVASPRRVLVDRTALNLRELIEGNVGADVFITERPAGREEKPLTYPAKILAVPVRSGQEQQATSPPNSGERLPIKGNVVLLKTDQGSKAVNLDMIQDITFKGEPKSMSADEEFRNLLTLKLDWAGKKPQQNVAVGMVYLQRGIRWIPSYKVTIDGKGGAVVRLQATLVNELTDLEDVTAHLVVGVPTFDFAEMVDPISLQQAAVQVARQAERGSRSRDYLSNAIQSQMAGPMNEPTAAPGGRTVDLGPEVATPGRSEDLFIFPVKHVTLKKGQRMVLAVAEFTLKYKDVYVLDLPFSPPPEVMQNFNSDQQAEVARLLSAPKAMHKLRLTNTSEYPLTTAPALIFASDRLLAQGMMTYTSIGGNMDLPVTATVDISIKKTDKETKRTPNAENWQGNQYGRIDLSGKISLTSFRKEPLELEVTRYVLGNVTEADKDGKVEMVNVFEDPSFAPSGDRGYPVWWRWYGWQGWWHHFNGVGKIAWKLTLEPGKPVDLGYTWNYYWR